MLGLPRKKIVLSCKWENLCKICIDCSNEKLCLLRPALTQEKLVFCSMLSLPQLARQLSAACLDRLVAEKLNL